MFKKLITLAATVAGAGALAVGGAAVASAAPSALVSTTTTFSYTVGQATVHTNGIVPPSHTPVQLNLSAAIRALGEGTASSQTDAEADVTTLISHGVITSANVGANIPGADTILDLFAVNSAAHTFELSATSHGNGIVLPPFTVNGHAGTHGFASVNWLRFVAPHPVVLKPYVYGGHVITDGTTRATVGWSDGVPFSSAAWMSGHVGPLVNHCVEVQEFGYGFSATDGSPHVGYTCDNGNPAANVGYLTGLAPGHTYFLKIQPAVGTYMSHHAIPGTNDNAGVTVVTVS